MQIYADNAATTKMSRTAIDAMLPYMETYYGNPSSLHTVGQQAAEALMTARQTVAACLGCQPREITFTSGGSEADNQALISAARIGERKGKKHIISTAFEHHAILHTLKKLEKEGFEVELLPVGPIGTITAQQVADAIRPDTCLVTTMYANNEIGSILPIPEIGAVCREKNVLFHTDAVQGFLKVPFRAKALGADMISVSAHKIHAAKGTGALYIRPGLPLPAFINGGGQESNYRSGTENMPGICGFGAACAGTDAKADIARMTQLRDLAREKLAQIDGLVLIGSQAAPHIVNLSLPGLRSQGIINCLQSDGIYVSAGSACSKGHRSHVLEAMHLSPAVIDGSIRVSFSRDNTEADVDALCQALLHAKQTLKG